MSTTIVKKRMKLWLPAPYLLLVVITLLYHNKLFAQVANGDWDKLRQTYKEGKLSDTGYLNAVITLAEHSFKDTALKNRLGLYKEVAWSKKEYQPFRIKFFSLLGTNASLTHREGAAMYYTQKTEEELKKAPGYINSLNEPRFLMAIYGRNESANRDKRQQIFVNALPFLKRLPRLIVSQKVPGPTCINAMTILNMASRLYKDGRDTTMVQQVATVSGNIWTPLQQKNYLPRGELMQCYYLYKQVLLTRSLLLNNKDEARKLLDESSMILKTEPAIKPVWARSVQTALLKKYIDFFIAQQQPDSSRHYMKLLTQVAHTDETDNENAYLVYNAKVSALENNFQQAYQYLSRAYEINDSVISIKTADINNNLYAQMMAEQKADEIQTLREQRQKRNIIIVLTAGMAIVCIALLLSRIRHNKKIAEKKVDDLNRLTQIEIAEMEEKANLIQRKLGMELHDDVASELAYVCHLIDKKVIEETDAQRNRQLQLIAEQTRHIYNNTRNKSHQWYMQGINDEQLVFTQSIRKLADYALPDGLFDKKIEIDDAVLKYMSYPVKIHLLRIIQTALANILKHAHANTVTVFLYEDEGNTVLQIKDNGVGLGAGQSGEPKGVGIRAIHERVAEMEGSFEILSDKNGTELVVTLPLKNKSGRSTSPGHAASIIK